MDQVQESACLSRCVGETRLTINKASNLVQSLRQFQKTVNFDAAPQVLSGLQLSGSTSAPRFISFPLACCAGGQRLRDRRAGIAGVAAHAKSVPRRRRSWRRPSTMPSIIGMWTRGLLIRRHIADGDLAFFTIWCPAGTSQPQRGRSRLRRDVCSLQSIWIVSPLLRQIQRAITNSGKSTTAARLISKNAVDLNQSDP